MPTVAAALLRADDPLGQVELVMDHHDLLRHDPEATYERTHRDTRLVHPGEGNGQRDAPAPDAHLVDQSPLLALAQTTPMTTNEELDHLGPDVVPAARVLGTRIAETDDERITLREMCLLTDKPVLYVANVAEDDLEGNHPNVAKVREIAASEGAGVVVICGKLEAEIAELDGPEKKGFLDDMGLEEAGLDRLIRNGYALLGLITYFTAGVKPD